MASDEGNWGSGIVGILIGLLVLVILITVLRIITRIHIAHSFWWDDVTIILAVIGTTLGAALGLVEVHYGFGKHERFLDTHQIREFRKYTYGEWIQTFFTLMFTKVSICLFLLRIPDSKALRYPLQIAIAFLIFSNTVLTVMWIMHCQPVRAAWDGSGDGGCMSRSQKEAIILTQAVISIVSDFALAMFPVLLLWRIQIDLKTKLGLWSLMGLGLITGGCCLVRTVINGQAIALDGTYDGVVNWIWRTFEVQIGIIAACVPTLRPLYLWVMEGKNGPRRASSLGSNIIMPLSQAEVSTAWIEDDKTRKPSSPRFWSWSWSWSRNSPSSLLSPSSSSSRDQGKKEDSEPPSGVASPNSSSHTSTTLVAPTPPSNPRMQTGRSFRDDMVRYGVTLALASP